MYTEKQRQVILTKLEFISERELKSMFDEYVDDTNDTVKVMGLEYQPSEVLKMTDDTAYRCGYVDWLDSMISAGCISDEIEGQHFRQDQVDDLLESLEDNDE